MVAGEWVSKTAQGVTLRWDYGEVSFARREIARVVDGRQLEGEGDVLRPARVTNTQAAQQ